MTSESIAASTSHEEIDKISSISNRKDRNRIFWVTEGTDTVKTAVTYEHIFKLFLKHVKIDDLQVLIERLVSIKIDNPNVPIKNNPRISVTPFL